MMDSKHVTSFSYIWLVSGQLSVRNTGYGSLFMVFGVNVECVDKETFPLRPTSSNDRKSTPVFMCVPSYQPVPTIL